MDVPVSAVGLAVQNDPPTKSTGCSSRNRPERPIFTANIVRPTPSSGCSIPRRLRPAPRRKSSSAAAIAVFPDRRFCFRPFAGKGCVRRHRQEPRQGARLGSPALCGRPMSRRSSCKRRRRKPRSSASQPARPTTSARSRPPANSASSRAASRWPACSRSSPTFTRSAFPPHKACC